MMVTIEATVPCLNPPAWAIMERAVFALMDQAIQPFLDKYTHPDGTLIWRDVAEGYMRTRDGADDFYESSFNWPLLYLLGGGDHLLSLGHRQWEAITRQLTAYGLVHNEYERGYDQFHQAESYIYFYFLCLADPQNPLLIERTRRFAGLYLNEDPAAPNYDAEQRIIRAPHNGSAGPRWGLSDGQPEYGWSAGMAIYGLPYSDVPGITRYDDLKDPTLARRMGQVMHERMGRGDVAANLGVVSLMTNAFLMTGEEKYCRWVIEYVDAWIERAAANGGLLPDNVGLSGVVGEYTGGKWYGGLYGWTWPHGFYNIGMAATVAALDAYLITGDIKYLDLPRTQMDHILSLGEQRAVSASAPDEMSLGHHWIGQFAALGDATEMLLVPYRYGDQGWFDYQPMTVIFPAALWNISMSEADWQRLERIRQTSGGDWSRVVSFRTKEESGHEQPWLRYLAGENPDYPTQILGATYGTICRRLELIRQDTADLTRVNIHHWQELNPISTEALVQLTLGAPQIVYNGGLLMCRLRYFDAAARRPGLPPDVAALVEGLTATSTTIHLVNLSPFATRQVIVQAGGFGEHIFVTATYQMRISEYPGDQRDYAAPHLETRATTTRVVDKYLTVLLPPATEITLDLTMERFVNQPSYTLPWDNMT